jgi:fibronectin-binding autotransporter adhesin
MNIRRSGREGRARSEAGRPARGRPATVGASLAAAGPQPGHSWRQRIAVACALTLALVATTSAAPWAGTAYAAAPETYIVTNRNDSGADSLRQAIIDANSHAGADTIIFSVTGTIELQTPLPPINDTLTITGPGAGDLIIDGAGSHQVLEVNADKSLTLSGVTIANGKAEASGGGIINIGTLTVTDSTFSANSAPYGGGGIFNIGMLTVTNSTFSENSAGDGGGISNAGNGTLTVTNSTFSANVATGSGGGGIFNNGGTLTVTNSTFSANSAAYGAGIRNVGDGTLSLRNTILSNGAGGGSDCQNYLATIAINVHNLIEDGSCNESEGTVTGFVPGDPKLGPLGDYSGPTPTMALLPDSPALNAANDASCPLLDQRGFVRSRGNEDACDIGAVEGAWFEVTSLADSGAGTLRDAITGANDLLGGPDLITFAPSLTSGGLETLRLTSGQLPDVTSRMVVRGPGARLLTISGGGTSRSFGELINPGRISQLELSDVTLANGTGVGGPGGALRVRSGTSLVVERVAFVSNSSPFASGAIEVIGSVTVRDSLFVANSTSGTGGAIFNNTGGSLTVVNSTFTQNQATNTGSIHNNGTASITNTTIASNFATGDNLGNGFNLRNSTGTLHLRNSIVSGNGTFDCVGDLATNDHNLLASGTCGSNDTTVIGPALLVALTDNGGPTNTLALGASSPAIDAGNNATCDATDQRGLPRPRTGADPCDLGAFEVQVTQPCTGTTTITCTYSSTGDVEEFEVPEGVTSIHVVAIGGRGADGSDNSGFPRPPGGLGAKVEGDLTVTPGETLHVVVGGNATGQTAGFNGGGEGGNGNDEGFGGARDGALGYGGGGASDIRTGEGLSSRLLVAGGGGGAGGQLITGGAGGNAGAGGSDSPSSYAKGGGAGGASVGGAGGEGVADGGFGVDGAEGSGGDGGAGGLAHGGGGGGGGYFGGGGGGGNGDIYLYGGGGGGGGSSYTHPTLVIDASIDTDDSGTPSVTISYTPPDDISYVVTTQLDSEDEDDDLSLREAITAANLAERPAIITFNRTAMDCAIGACTITLASQLPAIAGDLTITGPGADLTISGNDLHRVMEVASTGSLTLSGVTIANGRVMGTGGGVSNAGTLTVTDSTFADNTSYTSQGGGIYNHSTGVLSVEDSTFSANGASFGGGIRNNGTLDVKNSTFSGNSAAVSGGGISSYGLLNVTNSTFSGNTAASEGGGIKNESGTLYVINSTFSENSAVAGGGIYNASDSTLNLRNTILANSAATGGDCVNAGIIATNVHSLIMNGSSCETGGVLTGFRSGDPLLGALADNGGPTQTLAFVGDSPAINAGTDNTCPHMDQRGELRVSTCDIGAYELQGSLNLASLSLSAGTLAPTFAAGTKAYTATVPNGTEEVDVTATLADTTNATLSWRLRNQAGDNDYEAFTSPETVSELVVGANTIDLKVTVGSAFRVYTVVVTRESGDGGGTPPSVTAFVLQTGSDTGADDEDLITNASSLYYDVTFDVAVSGLSASDFTVVEPASGCRVQAPVFSDPAYTVEVRGCKEGTVTLKLKANSVSAGGNLGPTPDDVPSEPVTIDRTAPAATITGPVSGVYTITFSERVAGLEAEDFTISSRSTTVCAVGQPWGSAPEGPDGFYATWTVEVTGCSSGAVVNLILNKQTVVDVAGNFGPPKAARSGRSTFI